MAGSKLMLAVVLTSLAASAHCADDLDSLDEDFLSYLAELEGEDDDWTIVEPAAPVDTKPAKAAASDKPKANPVKQAETQKPTTPDDGSKP